MIIPWTYQESIVKAAPEGAKAFIYYLEFADGKRYIGKKNLFSTRKKKIPGKVRRTVTTTESNWKSYLSSSEIVKAKLKLGDKLVKREILRWCPTVGAATYHEAKLQFELDVLCDPLYLNGWISVKIMRCYKEDTE